MNKLTLNNCLGVTEIVIPLSPFWRQIAPSQGMDFPLASYHPIKKPLNMAVTAAFNSRSNSLIHKRGALYQSLAGFFSFFSQASITQAEKLVLLSLLASCSTCSLIRSIKSCGKRMPLVVDLLFLKPVAIETSFVKCQNTIQQRDEEKKVDVYKHLSIKCINTSLPLRLLQKAKPRSGGTLTGLLTNNVKEAYAMAIYKSTQTHPKFIFLFFAVRRADVNAKPQRAKVIAHSEREARLLLVADFVLAFAGRLPVQGGGYE